MKELNRGILNALSPPLSESDEKVLHSIRKLTDFFLGDLDLTAPEQSAASMSSNDPTVLRSLVPDQAAVRRAQSLIPVLQENQKEMRQFGLQIVGRLTELQTTRALGYVRDRAAPSPAP